MTARWMTRWKPAVGFGIVAALGDQVLKLRLQVGGEVALELLHINVAGAHHGGGILIVDQGEQQVLQRRVFVVPLVGERERPVKRLLKTAGKGGH